MIPDGAASERGVAAWLVRFESIGSAADGLDPDRLGVVHASEGGLLLLPTASERTDDGLVVTAETDGFSQFALVQFPEAETTTGDGEPSTEGATRSETESTDADGTAADTTTGVGALPVFELLVVAALLVLAGALLRR